MARLILTLLISSFVLVSGASAAETETDEIKVSVSGMSCMSCVRAIEREFNGHQAVKSAKVSLSEKLLTMQLNSHEELSDEEIESMLSEAGYTAVAINRTQETFE